HGPGNHYLGRLDHQGSIRHLRHATSGTRRILPGYARRQAIAQPLDTYAPYRETAADLVRDPAWPSVTPRMPLGHTSGLANFAFMEPDKKMHLHFSPGTQYRYSGEGINLVQFTIEQRKGRPLDQLMQEAFFTPLGMKRTGLIYREEFAGNAADRF